MCKIEFIKIITHLDDSGKNTENFLSLLRDEVKREKLNILYEKVKEIKKTKVKIEVLPSYNNFSKVKREKNLEVVYLKMSNKDFDKLKEEYQLTKEKNKIMILL